MKTKLLFINATGLTISFLLGLATLLGTRTIEKNKPNIIIILADDAGYDDFGFMGSKDIKTPNLDRLAGDGILFTQNYVSASVCSPSRAGLLTGKYQQRFGHECNLEPEQPLAFDTAQTTMAEAVKKVGYKTAIFGKWHLGDYPHQHPLKNGFDHFWGFIAGGRSYFRNISQDKKGSLTAVQDNYKHVDFDGYLTDAIGAQTVNYIHKTSDPFFIYLAFNAPHTPMDAKKEVVEEFKNKTKRPVYAAMMWSMDEAIGKVIRALKQKGIYDNTLIFFLSDNGGAHNNNSSTGQLKGWKGNSYEGGIRVPMIVSWPAVLKGNKNYDGISSSLDIFPTALKAAGVRPDIYHTDGKDLLTFLESKNYSANIHRELFWRKDKMDAARIGQYKLIRLDSERYVLYDIKKDISESVDISRQNESEAKEILRQLNNWETKLIKPNWVEPDDWNKVTLMIYEDLMDNRPIRVKAPTDLKKTKNDRNN